jgi:ferredoxin-NADP reductase
MGLALAGAGPLAPVRTHSRSSAPNAVIYGISVRQEPRGRVSRYLNLCLPQVPRAESTTEGPHDRDGQ